jgi:DNA-binding NarL/FixJ family response regulator
MMIRVLICDDQELVCEGLKAILGTSDLVKVMGMVYNGLEAIDFLEKNEVDVVLMDLKMPILNGIQATKQIKEKHPEVHILVLTTYDADEWVLDAIRYGADGYMLKDAPRERLLQAIEEVNVGKTPVDSKVAGRLFEQITKIPQKSPTTIGSNLTDREREVLLLISHGKSNAEIAESLFLSEGTVRNYVSSILEKLDVTDRTQAAVIAIRSGLVD